MKKQFTTIILTVFLVVVLIICFAFVIAGQLGWFSKEPVTAIDKCEKYNGIWLSEFSECENISEEVCSSNGGFFNACGSACRHNPEAKICSMQCVPFCEYATINSKADLIRVNYPQANQVIEGSSLEITGLARGTWFFEASFPVQIRDLENKILFEGLAEAKADWMTIDFVPFELKVNLESTKIKGKIELVLKKDNPSGLPANDDELIIPIEIK
ncbi:MAG: hypothetical protein A2079_07345 [Geobacteraceae bacterium GWC2_48_7]|nr:MAG: hypothetical protein UT91_C0011G0043 [Parcubacteria group bacterium GW2011_GWA2_40_23]OGT98564.1 MAG: hypothetical protein A2079_07345 [Geobacteraceae bacterium GWC2_48_7]